MSPLNCSGQPESRQPFFPSKFGSASNTHGKPRFSDVGTVNTDIRFQFNKTDIKRAYGNTHQICRAAKALLLGGPFVSEFRNFGQSLFESKDSSHDAERGFLLLADSAKTQDAPRRLATASPSS